MGFRSDSVDLYRVCFPHLALDGSSAARTDAARWNSRGRHIIYACEHYATAVLEKAVQLNSSVLPRNLACVRIAIPPKVTTEDLQWEDYRAWDSDDMLASQRFGDRWYDERRSLVLFVPSLAAPGLERNVLINASHVEFPLVVSTHEPLVPRWTHS